MADTTATPVRLRAPISLAGHRAAPTPSALDITDPTLRAQAENALAAALDLLHAPCASPADLQRATGRVMRAATLMKRACAAQAQRGAA